MYLENNKCKSVVKFNLLSNYAGKMYVALMQYNSINLYSRE